jgi:hypothetical protein
MDIDEDKTFYTATMARVLADQGRYAQAARIYRYLLDQTPDRVDLEQALNDVLSKLPGAAAQWEAVSDVIARWVRLMLRCKALRQIQHIRIPRDHPGP